MSVWTQETECSVLDQRISSNTAGFPEVSPFIQQGFLRFSFYSAPPHPPTNPFYVLSSPSSLSVLILLLFSLLLTSPLPFYLFLPPPFLPSIVFLPSLPSSSSSSSTFSPPLSLLLLLSSFFLASLSLLFYHTQAVQ